MKYAKKITALGLILATMFSLSACRMVFMGNQINTTDSYFMEYSIFTGTENHTFNVKEGELLDIEIVNESGTLGVTIQKDDDDPIYDEENSTTDHFQLTPQDEGSYVCTLTAEKAKGSVKIKIMDEASTEATELH